MLPPITVSLSTQASQAANAGIVFAFRSRISRAKDVALGETAALCTGAAGGGVATGAGGIVGVSPRAEVTAAAGAGLGTTAVAGSRTTLPDGCAFLCFEGVLLDDAETESSSSVSLCLFATGSNPATLFRNSAQEGKV
jgi:hypothetical protein